MTRRIGLNLAFIDGGPLTGPGYYARELVERLVRLARDDESIAFIAYVQPAAFHHFSPETQRLFVPVGPFDGRISRVLWEQLVLPWRVRRARLDLLFSPAFVSPLWGAPHRVATIHDIYWQVVPDLLDAGQRRYWRLMVPLTARRCDALIAVSENTRRDLEAGVPAARGKAVAIPLASRYARPEALPAPPPEASRPYVLLVANVTANKNPAALVEALGLLLRRGLPLRLVHVGNDLDGRLASVVRAHGLTDHVLPLGKVEDARLQALYAHALCTVHPSLYEGFGLPVLEAQALGSPLVCSNRGALPETAGEGALFVDPTDPQAIADAIATLHESPERRAELIARGHANLARFSWDRTAAATLALFRRLLATPATGTDRDWETWGRTDPYFAVLTDPRYRLEEHRDDFFATGTAFFDTLRQRYERSFGPLPRGRALDFGCGVGRLALALAGHFEEVVGLDVSPAMLAEAEGNACRFGRPNLRFAMSDDALSNAPGRFDFVNSYIVLQHIPTARGLAIIRRLLDRIRPGGGCLIHVSVWRRTSALRRAAYWARFHLPGAGMLLNLAKGRPAREPGMQMNEYPLPALLTLFEQAGMRELRLFIEDHHGVQTVGILAQKPD